MASISLKYKSKQGSLTAPGDVDPGAMIPIATVTVGSGGQASVEFTSIPQYYEHLQIRAIAKRTTAGTGASYGLLRFNSDTTSANYRSHEIYGAGASATAGDYSGFGGVITQRFPNAGETSIFCASVLDILDYANTNKYKVTRNLAGYDANGSGQMHFTSGLWLNTNAVTSITMIPNADNWAQYSSFALYGIKRAGA